MQQLSYEQLQNWQAEKKPFQLIDVRERIEHEQFNIGGELMPLGEIFRQTERIRQDVPVVVYCKRGIRSQIAVQRLALQLPEVQFFNLQGGVYDLKYNNKDLFNH